MIGESDFDISSVGCLALLWPAVDECLIMQSVRPRLEQAASTLAPLGRIALELGLAPGAGAVDLHQFLSGDTDAAILKRHLTRAETALPQGEKVRAFLSAWADDRDGLRADIDHLFLEWDRPAPGLEGSTPAIFLPVERWYERGAAGMRRRESVAHHLDQLSLAGPHLAEKVRQIFRTMSPDLSISYIGFMLGRSADAVRVNLRGIRPADLRSVLDRLAWPGDHAAWRPYFSSLVERADTVAVAIDFAPDLKPTLGFEAALGSLPDLEPRWPQLVNYLMQRSLCTADKGAALGEIGARLYPEQRGQRWPASWLAAAAMAPPICAPWFERRLSHVKVSISGEGQASAKAYVSAQHYWSRREKEAAPQIRLTTDTAEDCALVQASNRAVDFLLAARSQDDLWRDFRLVNGVSDEWVSGFVGFALAGAPRSGASTFLDRTVSALLRRQRADSGWGYNAISPSDADSTAWVLKMLRSLKQEGEAAKRGQAFLRAHLLPTGGLATYAPSTRILFGVGPPTVEDAGWRGSHSCVAANAAALLPDPLVALLRADQRPEGNWTAYWWRNDIFATALAVQALCGPDASASRKRASDWARKQVAVAGSEFDRAWLIHILCAGGDDDRRLAREMCQALTTEQRENGSWKPGAEMLFTRPGAHARSDRDSIILDHKGLFTTASVLMAIEEVFKLEPCS